MNKKKKLLATWLFIVLVKKKNYRMHLFLTVSRSWNNIDVLLIARGTQRRYNCRFFCSIWVLKLKGFHLSRIRNVFISIELMFISLIFLASGGECIKDKDVGVRLSTLNLLKSLCTFICRENKSEKKKKNYIKKK